MAQAYDIVSLAIETRKDQIEALEWQIKPTDPKEDGGGDSRIKELTKFWRKPDGEHDFVAAPRCELRDNNPGSDAGSPVTDEAYVGVARAPVRHRGDDSSR